MENTVTSDLINGGFEAVSGAFVCLNIKALLRDKQVKGISLIPATFFAIWGVWNMVFYPSLNLWWSFAGAWLLTTVSSIWLWLAVYFNRKHPT